MNSLGMTIDPATDGLGRNYRLLKYIFLTGRNPGADMSSGYTVLRIHGAALSPGKPVQAKYPRISFLGQVRPTAS